MIYAERYDDTTGYIAEKGVFLSMEDFLPYRQEGWSSTTEIDARADELIQLRNTPENVLKYLAPMIRTGEAARDELHRRR